MLNEILASAELTCGQRPSGESRGGKTCLAVQDQVGKRRIGDERIVGLIQPDHERRGRADRVRCVDPRHLDSSCQGLSGDGCASLDDESVSGSIGFELLMACLHLFACVEVGASLRIGHDTARHALVCKCQVRICRVWKSEVLRELDFQIAPGGTFLDRHRHLKAESESDLLLNPYRGGLGCRIPVEIKFEIECISGNLPSNQVVFCTLVEAPGIRFEDGVGKPLVVRDLKLKPRSLPSEYRIVVVGACDGDGLYLRVGLD